MAEEEGLKWAVEGGVSQHAQQRQGLVPREGVRCLSIRTEKSCRIGFLSNYLSDKNLVIQLEGEGGAPYLFTFRARYRCVSQASLEFLDLGDPTGVCYCAQLSHCLLIYLSPKLFQIRKLKQDAEEFEHI